MNFVDLLFLVFVVFYGFRGFQRGAVRESLDLMGFVLGVGLGVRFYAGPAQVLRFLGFSESLAKVIGGSLIFAAFIVGTAVLSGRLHREWRLDRLGTKMKAGGAAVAVVWSTLFGGLLLAVLAAIPTPVGAQQAISESAAGKAFLSPRSPLYSALDGYARHEARNVLFYLRQYVAQVQAKKSSGQIVEEFFTIQPSERIELDGAAERAIFELVNEERAKEKLPALTFHTQMQRVARAHSSDMYKRGYFAHVNPDGADPFNRMAVGGVTFSFAGENLALAPTVLMVHQGLMNSPRHKENILKKEFTDVGIGVYKGPYGLMVTQNFCSGCR